MLTKTHVCRFIVALVLAAAGSSAAPLAVAAPAGGAPAAPEAPAYASPHLFAHFAESPGSATDLTLYAFYPGGLVSVPDSGSATISLYLYSGLAGQPLKSATNVDVCNPCATVLTTTARSAAFSVEAIINSKGGFPAGAAANLEGYGVVAVTGTGSGDVSIHLSQKENGAAYELPLTPLDSGNVSAVAHFTEAPGSLADLLVYLSYGAGQGGLFSGGGANADLYLLTASGQPLKSATSTDVCNPCTYALTTSARHQVFRLETAILAAGGFAGPVSGTALIVRSGPDPLGLAQLAVQRSPFATNYLPLAQR